MEFDIRCVLTGRVEALVLIGEFAHVDLSCQRG